MELGGWKTSMVWSLPEIWDVKTLKLEYGVNKGWKLKLKVDVMNCFNSWNSISVGIVSCWEDWFRKQIESHSWVAWCFLFESWWQNTWVCSTKWWIRPIPFLMMGNIIVTVNNMTSNLFTFTKLDIIKTISKIIRKQ